MDWTKLVHIGDLEVMLPAAAAITVWLVASRAWQAAIWWSVLFGAAIALVAASKIAFIGWGTGIAPLAFKALSGHATCVAAVAPSAAYLLAHEAGPRWRRAAVGSGVLAALAMGVALVALGEHAHAEVAVAWVLGFSIAYIAMGTVRELRPARLDRVTVLVGACWLTAAWQVQSLPLNYWMLRAALVLSGSARPFEWETWQRDC